MFILKSFQPITLAFMERHLRTNFSQPCMGNGSAPAKSANLRAVRSATVIFRGPLRSTYSMSTHGIHMEYHGITMTVCRFGRLIFFQHTAICMRMVCTCRKRIRIWRSVFCTHCRCFFPGFALDFTAFSSFSFSFSCFFFHATATWKERSSSASEWSLGLTLKC